MSIKIINKLAMLLLVENIIVQALIWGTVHYPKTPKTLFEWAISLTSLLFFLVLAFLLFTSRKRQ